MYWARAGVWEHIFADLVADKKERASDDRFDQCPGTPASGHRAQNRGFEDPALGRSGGGLSSKVHLLANEPGAAGGLPDFGRIAFSC